MSEELIQAQNQVKGLNAQLQATKEMLNESLQNQLTIRSSLVVIQQHSNDLMIELAKLKDEKANLETKLKEFEAKAPVVNLDPKGVKYAADKI